MNTSPWGTLKKPRNNKGCIDVETFRSYYQHHADPQRWGVDEGDISCVLYTTLTKGSAPARQRVWLLRNNQGYKHVGSWLLQLHTGLCVCTQLSMTWGLTDMMSKKFGVLFIAIEIFEVFHVQPEQNELNGWILHTKVHQLQNDVNTAYKFTRSY